MKIPANDFVRQWNAVANDVAEATRRVGVSGWYILGERVAAFERALERAWPLPHAIGVANGLDAIEIGLRCLGLQPGGRVLTTPLSAFATTLAIVRAGGVPVFVDVDESGLIDLGACERVFAADSDIRHFVPVHLYGRSLDLDHLAGLRDRFELKIVEDCAQSIGARWKGRATGSAGQIAATSFYPTKNLGALGDGGAVLTGSDALAAHARELRHYGQTAQYVHDRMGLNSRLDELHAAILECAMLPRLDEWTRKRRDVASRYLAGIANRAVTLPKPDAGACWHLFPVLVEPSRRKGFMEHLKAAGVMSGIHYPHLIPAQKAVLEHGEFEIVGDLARARRISESEVSLPIHPFLTDEEIGHVVATCNAWRPA